MRISGKWLKKIGFSIGDHVELVLGERQIIIRPAVDDVIPNMVEEAPGTVIPD
jgi:antitoxin component of MazEF toxin-antitoxin module